MSFVLEQGNALSNALDQYLEGKYSASQIVKDFSPEFVVNWLVNERRYKQEVLAHEVILRKNLRFAEKANRRKRNQIKHLNKKFWEARGRKEINVFLDRLSEEDMIESKETVNHPTHYGGDTQHEVIKCLEAWGLERDALLWNVVKYISRAGKKGGSLEDLKKAAWYLNRRITKLENREEK
jgi:hypothetical protein